MGVDLSAAFSSMGPAAQNRMKTARRARQITDGAELEPRRAGRESTYRKLITSTAKKLARATAQQNNQLAISRTDFSPVVWQ